MPGKTPFPSLTQKWHTTPSATISPSRPDLSAKGKVVVITGGGSGIGASIARSFAEAGSSAVAIIGRREKNLSETKASIESSVPGSNVLAVTGDVTNADSMNTALQKVHSKFGKVNVFVSNAGYLSDAGLTGDISIDEWWRGFEVNVKGALIATQAFLKVGASDATVIEISSGIAHIGAMPTYSSYAASKIAGIKVFDSVQAEYPNLRVVHVHPGVVESDMNTKSGLGALDDAALPGHFVLWLTSPEAAFLKGKYTYVNWDVDELRARADEIQNSTLLTLTLDGWPFGKSPVVSFDL